MLGGDNPGTLHKIHMYLLKTLLMVCLQNFRLVFRRIRLTSHMAATTFRPIVLSSPILHKYNQITRSEVDVEVSLHHLHNLCISLNRKAERIVFDFFFVFLVYAGEPSFARPEKAT